MLQVIIPVYNDYKSLNVLLLKINQYLTIQNKINILVVDDCSSEKPIIKNKDKFNNISKIKILRLKQNVGSQKAIYIALKYLKLIKNNFYIAVIDGDGEDNPIHLNKMLTIAKKKNDYVVVSCRKTRRENLVIKFLYKLHLIIAFITTGKWISFGNFTTFHSKNIKKIILNKKYFLAFSSSIMKNCKIIKTTSSRSKRYFGKSKVSFSFLFRHSLKVIGVFYKRVFIFSLIYSVISIIYLGYFSIFLIGMILIFNLLILMNIKENFDLNHDYIKETYIIK